MFRINFLALIFLFVFFCSNTKDTNGTPYTPDTMKLEAKKQPPKTKPVEDDNNPASIEKIVTSDPNLMLGMISPASLDSDKTPNDFLMLKKQYALSYNESLNVQNWGSWRTTAKDYGDSGRYKGQFMPDASLPASWYRAVHKDYTNTDYDRGHQCPSNERTSTEEDNKATFILTNVIPQTHDLNAGPWERLEQYTEKLAVDQKKDLYITVGGIYPEKPKTIGNGLAVPSHNFKVIVVLNHGQGLKDITDKTRVIAVNMPNKKGIISDHWTGYRTTVKEIEYQTKYHFFSAVPDKIRESLILQRDSIEE